MKNFISALVVAGTASAYDQTLSSCNTFAALFSSTTGAYSCATATGSNEGTAMSGSGWYSDTSSGTTYTCVNGATGSNSWCVGDSSDDSKSSSCAHNFKQCVTCSEVSSVVYIRYQGNSMPNRCWQTTAIPNAAAYAKIDFTVTWNKDMTGLATYTAAQVASSDDVTDILCDIQRTAASNIGNSVSYTAASATASIDTAGGVGLNGVMLFNGLALGNLDAVINEVETMDLCLEHASPQSMLHHHSIGPCDGADTTVGSTTTKPGSCVMNSGVECLDNGYMYAGWPTSGYGGVFGLAKDGHIIYGPYNADGELWTCTDIDVCNGFTSTDGSYAYASTTFFPYLIGCWGPAPAYTVGVDTDCSTNGCLSGAAGLKVGLAALTALYLTVGQ